MNLWRYDTENDQYPKRDLAPKANVLRCRHRQPPPPAGGGVACQWGGGASWGWHLPWGGWHIMGGLTLVLTWLMANRGGVKHRSHQAWITVCSNTTSRLLRRQRSKQNKTGQGSFNGCFRHPLFLAIFQVCMAYLTSKCLSLVNPFPSLFSRFGFGLRLDHILLTRHRRSYHGRKIQPTSTQTIWSSLCLRVVFVPDGSVYFSVVCRCVRSRDTLQATVHAAAEEHQTATEGASERDQLLTYRPAPQCRETVSHNHIKMNVKPAWVFPFRAVNPFCLVMPWVIGQENACLGRAEKKTSCAAKNFWFGSIVNNHFLG